MASTITSGFYDGSLIFEPFARLVSLPIDQVNHLVCQLFCLGFGFLYRTTFAPWKVGATVRHLIQFTLGLFLVYFCFGRQTIHMIAQSLTCYLLMMYLKPGVMEKVVFVASLGYLCLCHIYRQIYDYGGYTLDITGPLMITTQRLSSLAFALSDGLAKDKTKLSPILKKHAIKEIPGLLPFLSYMFSFHGVMCGPFAFYKDFIAFIEGTDQSPVSKDEASNSLSGVSPTPGLEGDGVMNNQTNHIDTTPKSRAEPVKALLTIMMTAVLCGVGCMFVNPHFPVEYIIEPEFSERSLLSKLLYIVVSTSLMRQKYYLAWALAQSCNTSNGFGFNGYDSSGNSKWDLISNADIYKVETATSLKVVLDNWNITTTLWLRYVVYERVHSSGLVFLFSAFWHGFYPGYYFTFLTGALLVEAGRGIRRHIRPHFQTTGILRFIYEVVTFIGTRLALSYSVYPFVLLKFWLVFGMYRQLYFVLHIPAVVLIGVFTLMPKQRLKPKPKAE